MPPTIKEELERKTVTALDGLAIGLRHGEITDREFHVAVTAMCDVVSGLIDVELLTMLSQARMEMGG